jgi:hypothetical protein
MRERLITFQLHVSICAGLLAILFMLWMHPFPSPYWFPWIFLPFGAIMAFVTWTMIVVLAGSHFEG